MQVEEFLERSARRFPEKTALVFGERRLTYRQIETQCNQLAHGLMEKGVQRGDRVAVLLDTSVEAVLSIFAILKAGAVFTVVNPAIRAEKLAHIMNNCGGKSSDHRGQQTGNDSILLGSNISDLETVIVAGEKSGDHRDVAKALGLVG